MIGVELEIAEEQLRQGNLVGIPTETVYGLAGNALVPETVAKIFEAKNRPSFDPLIIHTSDLERAMDYTQNFPDWARVLAVHCWPGPLTLLLPKKNIIPDIVTNGSELTGIRVPDHQLTLALLKSLPFPLAAPSANPFGYISPTTAQHVAAQLNDKVSYILDGGPCSVGLESTIVGIKEGKPAIFRTGGIPVERIGELLGESPQILQSTSNPQAPGMLASHYAPRKPLYFGNIKELVKQFRSEKKGIISFSDDYSGVAEYNYRLSPDRDLHAAASNLFAAMRELDNSGAEVILAEPFPEAGLGRAINDRLKRASTRV